MDLNSISCEFNGAVVVAILAILGSAILFRMLGPLFSYFFRINEMQRDIEVLKKRDVEYQERGAKVYARIEAMQTNMMSHIVEMQKQIARIEEKLKKD